jgi:SWIM zinc finger
MAFNSAKIEALAPDRAALDAARKLLKPGVWPTLASDDAGLVWGEAQGSGATPYRVVVCEIDAGYKCSCPSRKFPCKHSLALMWMRAEGKLPFARLAPPNWVNEWLSRRRGPSQSTPAADAAPKASIEAAASGQEPAGDPKAEARAAAQQERNRQARERSVLAGLDELDLWLSDQLERGVVAFLANAAGACRQVAQRLVDAKASTLAGPPILARAPSRPRIWGPIWSAPSSRIPCRIWWRFRNIWKMWCGPATVGTISIAPSAR